jgi:hypothetical protein
LFSREIVSSSPTTPFQALGCEVQENDNGSILAWPLIFFTFENIPTNTKEVFCQEHPLARSTLVNKQAHITKALHNLMLVPGLMYLFKEAMLLTKKCASFISRDLIEPIFL